MWCSLDGIQGRCCRQRLVEMWRCRYVFGQNKARAADALMEGRRGSLFVVVLVVSSDVSWHLDVKEAEQKAVCLAVWGVLEVWPICGAGKSHIEATERAREHVFSVCFRLCVKRSPDLNLTFKPPSPLCVWRLFSCTTKFNKNLWAYF